MVKNPTTYWVWGTAEKINERVRRDNDIEEMEKERDNNNGQNLRISEEWIPKMKKKKRFGLYCGKV